MQNRELILFAILVLGIIYATQPVPNCVDIPADELTNKTPDTTFTKSDILDIYSKLERGYLIINTLGDSMKGTINTNQRCICIPQEQYYIEDIVLFINKGTGIAHEIILKTQSGFITKGTNNDFADGEISKGQILCEIEKTYRWQTW